ncbi:MAG: 2,3-bisphosphoglycerate-independent phosphoglycerate mutase [Patescibacteria group bacterium]|nr:2,3-bisphosphoglycerate-independent phosphoglycerate mutase [Patescibacteria group bacterium]
MAEIDKNNKPLVLIILDGWGVAPPSHGNAITLARTPIFSGLIATYPTYTLQAAGLAVGLPWGEQGNSEVGHLNLGAGRIIYQTLPRIDKSISEGDFFHNPVFLEAINHVKKNNSKLHLLGLISNGNIHSSIDHLEALLELAKRENLKNVYLHGILDGRDTPYNSGFKFVERIQRKMKEINFGEIATLAGRFYAMDRDNHWSRIEKVYLAMTEGISEKKFTEPLTAITESYQQKVFDEEFVPTVIVKDNQPVAKIEDNDAVIFFNFRADRSRELTKAFVVSGFENFLRKRTLQNLFFVTFTDYEEGLPVKVAFPSEKIEYPLAQVLAEAELSQLHLAETEKYAHVTYFFNGGQEKKFSKEDWLLIPSPRVSSYDQKPAMSAVEITRQVILSLTYEKYDFILVNFANPDMVGHTGNLLATIEAIETVDRCLGQIIDLVLKKNAVALVTADHGNAEELINLQTGKIDKEHSTNPVPFIFIKNGLEERKIEVPDLSKIKPAGVLADVGPTILKLLDIPQPKEMTGRPLI